MPAWGLTKSEPPLQTRSIDLLIPCHNEAASAAALLEALNTTIQTFQQPHQFSIHFNLIIVDDGSSDQTCQRFEQLIRESKEIRQGSIISLSRNFGKEAAMLAGLNHCEGDACIILDADLQDPPSLIPEIIYAWLEGYQVVNAVRHDRSSDSLLKRLSSEGFYAIFLKLSKLKVQFNASDFRLLDRAAITTRLQPAKNGYGFLKDFSHGSDLSRKISTLSDRLAILDQANGAAGNSGTMPWMASSTFQRLPCASGAISVYL
jgi:glycosyltransferase involved in cell wall biosynthesis